MLKPLLKKAIPIIAMIPLLGSCSLFQPETKVIEYDEEVKLHDGSMIWVHIKRHYERSNGREISNWFQGYEKGWGAKEVEISWDTGFPNVGRKKVTYSQSFAFINKFDNKWYLYGVNSPSQTTENKGARVNNGVTYMTIIDNSGYVSNQDISNEIKYINILNPTFADDTLEGKKWSWQDKLSYQKQTNRDSLFKPINLILGSAQKTEKIGR